MSFFHSREALALKDAEIASLKERLSRSEGEAEAAAAQIAELTKQLEAAKAETAAAVEHFRSRISHSIRMPVSIVQGYAEILEKGMAPDKETRSIYLRKICQRMDEIHSILARELGKEKQHETSEITRHDADLLAILHQLAEDVRTTSTEKKINIQVVSGLDRLDAFVDVHLLNRAFFNIVDNSFKYMNRPGMITITASEADGCAVILFRDDGIGLSPEETASIFESGFQGSNRKDGSGYGLSAVKAIIEAHGGSISANSSIGMGMSITMRLPLYPASDTR